MPERKRRRKKNKVFNKKFTIGYLTFIALVLIVFGIVLSRMWVSLGNYEKNQVSARENAIMLADPDPVALSVFETYFKDFDYSNFYEMEKSRHSEFETLEHYIAFLSEKKEGYPLEYNFIGTPAADERLYGVYAGDSWFAEFTLKKQLTAPDQPLWVFIETSTIYDRMVEPFEVLAPVNSQVFVNGFPVGNEYISGETTPSIFEGPHTRYMISNLIFEPDIFAVLPDGTNTPLFYDQASGAYILQRSFTADILSNSALLINSREAGGAYPVSVITDNEAATRLNLYYSRYLVTGSFGAFIPEAVDNFNLRNNLTSTAPGQYKQEIVYDDDLMAQYAAFAEEATTTYCEYMTNDGSLTEVRRFFATGTPTYDAIRTSEVIWYTAHIGYRFENIESSEFFWHDEEMFSCRVTLDHYVVRTTTDTHYFPLDVTLFFREVDGVMRVWELVANN